MALLAIAMLFVYCKKEDPVNPTTTTGTLRLEITDAPIDDAQVEGAFVTIADIRLDGQSIPGFTKQTIDLLAYQNGNVADLGIGELSTGSYSDLVIELDLDEDADGNTPGCYILTSDGERLDMDARERSSGSIQLNASAIEIETDQEISMVLDFDLRKAISRETGNNSSSPYQLVTDAELAAAVRLVPKAETGVIAGTCQQAFLFSDKVLVFAYEKGQFNSATEASPQGVSDIYFKNAVSSTAVGEDGSFSLHFLEAGNYEVHLVGFKDADADGTFELQGSLLLQVAGGVDLTDLAVEAGTTLSLQVQAAGILPL